MTERGGGLDIHILEKEALYGSLLETGEVMTGMALGFGEVDAR